MAKRRIRRECRTCRHWRVHPVMNWVRICLRIRTADGTDYAPRESNEGEDCEMWEARDG